MKTHKLPFDVSRCINTGCPKASTCLRVLAPGRPQYQTFSAFKGGDDCRHYIPMEEK